MTKKKNTIKIQMQENLARFMRNVNKQDEFVHRQTHDPMFGTVKLVKAAYEGGKRRFSVKNSIIHSGAYTYSTLRSKLSDAISAL